MHELSIALSIVETLTEELAAEPGRVELVRIRVGALSGVVPEALSFSWDVASDGTRFKGSTLEIEEVAPAGYCPRCEADRILPSIQLMRCPVCETPTPDIVAGRELELLSVEIEDDAETG